MDGGCGSEPRGRARAECGGRAQPDPSKTAARTRVVTGEAAARDAGSEGRGGSVPPRPVATPARRVAAEAAIQYHVMLCATIQYHIARRPLSPARRDRARFPPILLARSACAAHFTSFAHYQPESENRSCCMTYLPLGMTWGNSTTYALTHWIPPAAEEKGSASRTR